MMVRQSDDEETPFLQRQEQPTTRTPLPWDQLWIILLSQLSDPLAFQTLTPFIPQLIRDIGVIHGDESKVGYYVGILQSSYYAVHALTIFHWGQLSDHIGRKPVILTSLLALSVSMFSFGLSKTFLGLVVSRTVCGAFDASSSVIESMVMDITDATNMPKAYSYMPVPWMVGAVIGPLIGGSLSRPADRFPDIFGRSELLKTYPYLLPCSIPAIFVSVVWIVTYFRLKEVSVIVVTRVPLPGHHFGSYNVPVNPGEVQSKPLPLRALLTPRVSAVTASNATMGLFRIAFNSVLPIFYATPIERGGLSLDPPRIGVILAASSAAQVIFQLVFFARLHDHFGAGAIYITGISSSIPTVILFPVINILALWLCVAIQHALTISLIMCYPCLALFVRASAPNRASLGATNGIVQMFNTGARIIAPASAASVFSYSMQEGHDAWLIYYFMMAIAFLAVGASQLLPRNPSVWEDHQ
ncbi:MFS multidrug-resistance DHA1 sub-family [Suillus subalutaceus]|uniref:MFS multidrug-resistance DHA1 sub-family n=1 Tax=Suillus subalutaceus TaxID=48586 RepID=UPI001B875025|nr:MFS multidrug-resistance DHA1 sub-family [Suillus subalutaceus]KAG1877910.1 MFS multidrug-resistance DHA1 sub-family [Suillus subalutaceus]